MREQDILEKLCDRIVGAVHETFIKKIYFVKISQVEAWAYIPDCLQKKEKIAWCGKRCSTSKKYVKLLVVFLSGTN